MGILLSFDNGVIQTRLRPQLARPIRPWFKVLTDSIINVAFHGVDSLVRSSLNLESAGHILYTYGVPAVFILHET